MGFEQHFPALIVVILFTSAFLLPLISRRDRTDCVYALIAALVLALAMGVTLLIRVHQFGPFMYHMGGWPPPWGIEYRVDLLRVYMLNIVLAVSLWIMVYAPCDLENVLKKGLVGWYCSLYALLVGSAAGMTLTNDVFHLFVLMEICGIAACGIVSIRDNRECLEASFKYLILNAMGTGCFLLSVAFLYMVTGHLNYDMLRTALPEAAALYPRIVFTSAALLVVAFGVKAALFPMHGWLPDVYSAAPSPSSALLSGLVGKVYAFSLFVIYSQVYGQVLLEMMPLNEIVLWLAAVGMIFGSVIAIVQSDLKRMLAYSSIAQIGYVFLGIGLYHNLSLIGGLYHVLVHAVMKPLLFMSAGAIIYSTGVRHVKQLAGIGRVLPIVMLAFAIGGASMIGIPGTGGLISKWYLVLGSLDVGRPIFVAVILLSSLLNAGYFLPIIVSAFMHEETTEYEVKPVPRSMLAALIAGAAAIILLGVASRPVIVLLEEALLLYF